MAGSFNRVVLMGNLTRDPELKTLPSGSQVCDFGIAINERIKRGEQWEDYTNFFDVTAFSRNAENISKYFNKGTPIMLEGKLRFRQWEDRNSGQKRSKVEVIVDSWTFCESAPSGSSGGSRPNTPANIPDGDIPFNLG